MMRRLLAALGFLLLAWPLLAAPARERFLVYKVERIAPAAAPRIDGQLNEAVWQEKAAITNLRNFLGSKVGDVASQASEVTLLCDGKTLYLGATFHDVDMKSIAYTPAMPPFWNDCIELYFDPRHDGTRSIQLVVDCGGQKMWQKRFDDGYGWWEDSAWYILAKWEAAVQRLEDRWTVELSLDCASFGITPQPGKVSGFNICRFRLGAKDQEFSAWGYNLATTRQKAMESWGHLLFGAEGQQMRGAPLTRADIRLVYPDLGDRMLEVGMDGGFMVYTTKQEQRLTFKEILDPVAAAAQQQVTEVENALAALGQASTSRGKLTAELDTLKQDFSAARRDLDEPKLTMGKYDSIADRMHKVRATGHDLYWKIKVAELVETPGGAR